MQPPEPPSRPTKPLSLTLCKHITLDRCPDPPSPARRVGRVGMGMDVAVRRAARLCSTIGTMLDWS